MGLKLTILGSSAAWSERLCAPSSCYMLEIGEEAVLLDLGQGALAGVYQHRDPSTLTAVIVSHMHGDHHVDLIPMRNMLYYHFGEPRSVGLHLPRELRQRYDTFMGEEGFFDFMPGHDVFEGSWEVGPFTVRAIPVTHSENSHAFRVTDSLDGSGPGLVYSGDCGRADDLLPLVHPGDTLLCEAFWSTRVPIPSANHLNAEEAADLAIRTGAQRLILTHVLDDYDRPAALKAAEAIFPGPVFLAEPGMVFEVGEPR